MIKQRCNENAASSVSVLPHQYPVVVRLLSTIWAVSTSNSLRFIKRLRERERERERERDRDRDREDKNSLHPVLAQTRDYSISNYTCTHFLSGYDKPVHTWNK